MTEIPSFWEARGAVPQAGASPANLMTEAEIAAAKARIARLAPYSTPGAIAAPALGAAAPSTAVAPITTAAPTGAGYRLGKVAGRTVGGTLLPALALGEMGAGMAEQAAATTVGAVPENRPERALQILSGADVTGLGTRIGRMLSGGDFFGPGAVPTTSAPAAVPAPVAPTGSVASYLNGPGAVANNTAVTPAAEASPVVDGAWAAPHDAAPGIGAQLVAGPATTAVSSSRDANGNLVLTNAPPGPAGPGAAPAGYKAAPGSLASFYGAAMTQRHNAATDAANRAIALKLPELTKQGAEATILSERMKLAAAETDPAKKAAILAGHVMPEPKLQAPPSMQPLPGDKDQSGVVFNPNTGAFKKVPITTAPKVMTMAEAMADAKKYGKTPTPAQIRADAAQKGITIKD